MKLPISTTGERTLERTLLGAGLVLEVAYIALVALGDLRLHFHAFLATYGTAFVAYLVVVRAVRSTARGTTGLRTILVLATIHRATLLVGVPSLSDDIHRYVWDGAVLANLENPYLHAPADPERIAFAALATRVNHPEISTVYPPLAELLFALAAGVSPSTRSLRVMLVLGEAVGVLGLIRLLRARGRPLAEVAVVAWCPLQAVETALSGHVDVVAIGLLLWGLAHVSERRKGLSTALLSLSVATKYLAVAVLGVLVRRLGALRVVLGLAAVSLMWLPFAGAGRGLVRGLGTYAGTWEFNAPLFRGLVAALDACGSVEVLKECIARAEHWAGDTISLRALYYHVYPQEVARVLVGLCFGLFVVWVAVTMREPLPAAAAVVFAFVLLTPTLHPWYALWALPFVIFVPSRAFLALTGLVALSYGAAASAAAGRGFVLSPGLLALEYGPFYALLAADARRARRLAGPGPRRPGGGGAGRHQFLGPPSPFRGRSTWRRFREDTWPGWRDALRSLWGSSSRTPVLIIAALLLVVLCGFSLRRLEPLSGRVERADGAAAVDTRVTVLWYTTAVAAVVSEGRTLQVDFEAPEEGEIAESTVREATVATDDQGAFRVPGGLALVWPGRHGPYARVRLVARDPLSGQPYPVRRFTLGDGTEVTTAYDSRLVADRGRVAADLARLIVPSAGRALEIAVAPGRIAVAEGEGGVRLYGTSPDGPPRFVAHQFPGEGGPVESVAFGGRMLLAARAAGAVILDPEGALREVATVEGSFERLLGWSDDRFALLGVDGIELFRQTTPPQTIERWPLNDRNRKPGALGPEGVRMLGSLIFHAHSDGTVRVLDIDGAFRSPATLSEAAGPIVAYDVLSEGSRVVIASPAGASVFDVTRADAVVRLGRVDLAIRPVTVRGMAIVGEKGIVLLEVAADGVRIARQIDLVMDEVEGASAMLSGGEIVIPDLEEVTVRTVTRGIRWNPMLGKTMEIKDRLRDSARLTGARLVDLTTGQVRAVTRPSRERVAFRQDGRNLSLVQSLLPDGAIVYGKPDGALLVESWR